MRSFAIGVVLVGALAGCKDIPCPPLAESCAQTGRAGCLACDVEQRAEDGDGDEVCNLACSAFVTCGNGGLDPGEVCDDGPWGGRGASGCAADCASTTCGDAVVASGELCFDEAPLGVWADGAIAADVDDDGDADLVVGGVGSFLGPTFTTGPGYPLDPAGGVAALAAGQLDRAGPVEIVVADAARLAVVDLKAMPGRLVQSVPLPAPGGHVAVATGDADGDGDVDVVAVRGTTGTVVLRNDGTGALTAGPTTACALATITLANLDADPALEAVGLAASGGIAVCDAAVDGYLATPLLVPPTGEILGRPFVLDADRDGELDLMWSRPGAIVFARGQGGLVFAEPVALTDPATSGPLAPALVAVAPLDGDAVLDLLLADGTVLAGDGAGGFAASGAIAPATEPDRVTLANGVVRFALGEVVVGDFVRDGRPDVVSRGRLLRSGP